MIRQKKVWRRKLALAACLLSLASPSFALEDVGKETIILHLKKAHNASTKNRKAEIRKDWQKVCDSLGKALTHGGGAWGYGPFDSYSCLYQNKLFPRNFKTRSAWVLEAIEKKNSFSFTLMKAFRNQRSSNPSIEAMLDVPTTDDTFAYLAANDVAKMVAFNLADKMPFAMTVDPNATEIKVSTDFSDSAEIPEPPAKLVIYSLGFDARKSRWVPEMRGVAKLAESKVVNIEPAVKPEEKGATKDKKKPHKIPAKAGIKRATATWIIAWEKNNGESAGKRLYWASDIRGRGMGGKASEDSLEKMVDTNGGVKQESFADTLLDQVAAGYVGVRYGQSILKGDPLLENAKFVGIFTEVRSGILDGLRFYADIGLEKKVKQYDLDLNFKWRRYVFGWSFAKDLDWWINRVDVVPKIGIMDIHSVVPLPSLSDPAVFTSGRFNMTNAFNFGAEIGIEKTAGWSMFRLWAASDFAIGFLQHAGGGQGTITSVRGGLDAYFDIARIGRHFELSLLLFGVGEKISLSQTTKNESALDDTTQVIEGLNYTYGFVGSGLSLAW